jgi:hypothetical protein
MPLIGLDPFEENQGRTSSNILPRAIRNFL